MRTQLVGHLDIDPELLGKEMNVAAGFGYSTAYSEFLCGSLWRSCMLWAAGGDAGDGLVVNYDHQRNSALTPLGGQLPYLRELIESRFDTTHLKFARLAAITDCVIIPHRDFLELGDIPEAERNTHRVHVPLITFDGCYFAEGEDVYHMEPGDVWFFDASQIHSAAALTERDRVHLILDFHEVADPYELLRFPLNPSTGIPRERTLSRPPVSQAERDRLFGLAEVITMDNFRDVFSIVIKTAYRRDGGANFIWNTLDEIGRRSTSEGVRDKIEELHRYFLLQRTEGTN